MTQRLAFDLGLIMFAAGSAACALPLRVQNACVTQQDCLDGYSCVAQQCVAGGDSASTGSGLGGGGTSSGTTGGTGKLANVVSVQSIVGCTDANTLSYATGVGPATRLAFLIQPADVVVNGELCPVVVAAVDANGVVVPSATADMNIALQEGGATLTGSVYQSSENGVAVFSGLKMTDVGHGMVMVAHQAGLSGTSQPFSAHAVAWTQIDPLEFRPPAIAVDPANGELFMYGGVPSAIEGTKNLTSLNGGDTWSTFTGSTPPVGFIQSAPYTGYAINYTAADGARGLAVTSDDGNTYTSACNNIPSEQCEGIVGLLADASTGTLVSYNSQQLYASQDAGGSWSPIIDIGQSGSSHGYSSVAVGHDVLYAAERTTHILMVSPNLSANYESLSVKLASPAPPPPSGAMINTIAVDPRDGSVVYIGATDGLFISHDAGLTFTQPLSGCISQLQTVAVGKETTVYAVVNDCWNGEPTIPVPSFAASTDGGATWQNASWGLQWDGATYYGGYPPTACGAQVLVDSKGSGTAYFSFGICGGIYRSATAGVN